MKKKATANNGVGYRADMEAVAVNSAHVHDAEGLRLKKGRGGHRFCMMGLIIATWVIYISTYVIGSVIGAGALGEFKFITLREYCIFSNMINIV